MNIRYLKQFLELISYTSLNQYAAYKNVTHAQVSHMVRELEKEFGQRLLIRDKNQNLKLTLKGEMLVKRIPFIFDEIEYMHRILSYDENVKSGIFDLYTTTYLIDYWIAPCLIKLKQDHPSIILNMFGKEEAPLEEEKKRHLTISPQTKETNDYVQVYLKDFHIGLWASQSYIDNYGLPKDISDLSQHVLICFERNWPDRAYPTINWYMNNTNFVLSPENVIVIKSSVGIMKAAQQGLGIFSLAEESIKTMGMKFERILPEIKGPVVPMCFSYPSDLKNHESIEVIQSFLTDIFTLM